MRILDWLFGLDRTKELMYNTLKKTNEQLAEELGNIKRLRFEKDARSAGSRIEIYQDKKNEWRWRLKAANHKIVAESGEGYKKRQGLEKNLNLVRDIMEIVSVDDQRGDDDAER